MYILHAYFHNLKTVKEINWLGPETKSNNLREWVEYMGVGSGWNLWVWLECTGVVSGCCKEIYRYPHKS